MPMTKKCNKCKKEKSIDNFMKGVKELKTCESCRAKDKASKNRNKCEHNRQKATCKICNDPIPIIIKQWIIEHRYSDKKKDRFEPDQFVEPYFLKKLLNDHKTCFYCKVPFEYINYCNELVTLERLDNNTGHVKSNCVLACKRCNLGTYRTNRLKAKFHQTQSK